MPSLRDIVEAFSPNHNKADVSLVEMVCDILSDEAEPWDWEDGEFGQRNGFGSWQIALVHSGGLIVERVRYDDRRDYERVCDLHVPGILMPVPLGKAAEAKLVAAFDARWEKEAPEWLKR